MTILALRPLRRLHSPGATYLTTGLFAAGIAGTPSLIRVRLHYFGEKLSVFLLMTTTQTATINNGRITEVAVALA
jgi:hypothetical protein